MYFEREERERWEKEEEEEEDETGRKKELKETQQTPMKETIEEERKKRFFFGLETFSFSSGLAGFNRLSKPPTRTRDFFGVPFACHLSGNAALFFVLAACFPAAPPRRKSSHRATSNDSAVLCFNLTQLAPMSMEM